MKRSLLPRLPDIVFLAREHARALRATSINGQPVRAGVRRSPAGCADLPELRPLQRVSLLCGDPLSAMLGLLSGAGRDGPLAGRLPLIWLTENPRGPADTEGTALTAVQRETRRLIDLATGLFLVRDLLGPQGRLGATLCEAPERGVERLLDVVFGQSHRLQIRASTGWRTFIAGGPGPLPNELLRTPPPAATLLGDLASHFTRAGEPVLVLNAGVPSTAWVGRLDRRWIFVQPDPMALALLREHVVARQMAEGALLQTEETGYGWAIRS